MKRYIYAKQQSILLAKDVLSGSLFAHCDNETSTGLLALLQQSLTIGKLVE